MRRVFFFLPALLTMLAGMAQGHSVLPKDFDALVAEAEQIFVGTVTATRPWKLPSGLIATDVTFLNLRVLKGGDGRRDLILLVLGGSLDGETLEVSGLPKFELGITYLVFSKGNGAAIFPVVGGYQGLFQIKRDPLTGDELVLNAQGKAITNRMLKELTDVSASTRDRFLPTSRVTLDTFIQAIEDRLGRQ